MKQIVSDLIALAVRDLQQQEIIAKDAAIKIQVDRTRDPSHGDLATNIALMIARGAGLNPRDMAQKIITALPSSDAIEKVEIAGPGFINFFLTQDSASAIVSEVLQSGSDYGSSNLGHNKKIHIEYVSANPTGPLHVGHGRGAAYGATVADILAFTGHEVHREYYVNDAGRQMHILAVSVWLRYLQQQGETLVFPVQSYKGEYIKKIASALAEKHQNNFVVPAAEVFDNVAEDETADQSRGDKEAHIDDLIINAKKLLHDKYEIIFNYAISDILSGIKDDLEKFGVCYQNWFSEQSLKDRGLIDDAIQRLTDKGYMYEQDGAIWFKSTKFGDDKDRVVVRENGETTYFASDIAYHMEKLDRGFNHVINVLGADHHGYVPRVKAAMAALGANPDQLQVPLVQFAILYRHGERVPMSTRSGQFVTLKELMDEVGSNAARFFYVMRKCEQHMDFDLDLAKTQSNENPMYYIQYAHARICSVFRQLEEQQLSKDPEQGLEKLSLLQEPHEQELMKKLNSFKEVIEKTATELAPHLLVHYLRELATDFHSYYNAHKIVIEETDSRAARVSLVAAVRQVLANGLGLLGVEAPEKM